MKWTQRGKTELGHSEFCKELSAVSEMRLVGHFRGLTASSKCPFNYFQPPSDFFPCLHSYDDDDGDVPIYECEPTTALESDTVAYTPGRILRNGSPVRIKL